MERVVKRRPPRDVIQGRVRDSGDDRWWSPQRDIAVLFVKMLRKSFYSLDPPDDPTVVDVMTKLGVTREMMLSLASAYGALILAVNQRKDALSWWSESGIRTHPANVALAAVFLDFMTEEYLQSYGETQYSEEEDPNDAERNDFCRSVGNLAAEKRSLWSEIARRARLAARAALGKL